MVRFLLKILIPCWVAVGLPRVTQSKPSPLLKDALSVQSKVESLRQSPITGKLKMGVVNKSALLKFLKKRIDEEYTSEEFRRSETQLKLLGLLPWNYDYRTRLEEIFVEQVGGYYDHKTKELYIAEWLPGFTQKPVLAHEIFHAVQVQEWDAGRLLDTKRFKLDTLLAHQALLEGDATVLMAHYLADSMNLGVEGIDSVLSQTNKGMMYQLGLSPKLALFVSGGDKFARAPRYVKRSLVLPYILGAQFIWHLKTEAGWSWKKINSIYTRPPNTTEHILLPETYWKNHERDTKPKRNFRIPAGWKIVEEDRLGLLMLGEAIDRNTSHDKPPKILEGWSGDELLMLSRKTESILVLNTLWDDSEDAKRFAAEFSESYTEHPAKHQVRRDKQVLIVLGRTATTLRAVIKEMDL